jgi:hypothetical protein
VAKDMAKIIKEVIEEQGLKFRERARTIYTTCPKCERDDKFSIIKENGSCVCYHGSCDFGRRWFDEWLSMTSRCTLQEAKERLRDGPTITGEFVEIKQKLDLNLNLEVEGPAELEELAWPLKDTIMIDHDIPCEGLSYLESRGIPPEVAAHYGIRYSIQRRRVIIPVFMNGKCYGWQGRAIDKVEDGDRMRNNEGFHRSKLVMFLDQIKPGFPAIISEGPFDAMKFHLIGGNVSTLGKEISEDQLELIYSKRPSGIYTALDADAANETTKLIERSRGLPVYTLEVPDSCKRRCETAGKKADFGECSFVEAKEAFANARKRGKHEIVLYLK